MDTNNPSDFQAVVDKYAPYFIEIRKRILFTFFFFLCAMILGFVFYEKIIRFLIDILSLQGVNIVFTSPFQFINLAISCGIATGLVLVFPLIVYQLLSFLRPALRRREFRLVTRLLPFALALFIVGFLFGVFIMQWQIKIFLTQSIALGIGNILDVSKLLTTVLLTSAILGLGFQFPLILLLLMHIGIVKRHHLSRQRPWVYLGSFLFAVLLPADSILADILLTLPLVLLFELTLLLNRVFMKTKI